VKEKKKEKIEEDILNLVALAVVVLVAGPWPAPVAQRVLLRLVGSHQRGW